MLRRDELGEGRRETDGDPSHCDISSTDEISDLLCTERGGVKKSYFCLDVLKFDTLLFNL